MPAVKLLIMAGSSQESATIGQPGTIIKWFPSTHVAGSQETLPKFVWVTVIDAIHPDDRVWLERWGINLERIAMNWDSSTDVGELWFRGGLVNQKGDGKLLYSEEIQEWFNSWNLVYNAGSSGDNKIVTNADVGQMGMSVNMLDIDVTTVTDGTISYLSFTDATNEHRYRAEFDNTLPIEQFNKRRDYLLRRGAIIKLEDPAGRRFEYTFNTGDIVAKLDDMIENHNATRGEYGKWVLTAAMLQNAIDQGGAVTVTREQFSGNLIQTDVPA